MYDDITTVDRTSGRFTSANQPVRRADANIKARARVSNGATLLAGVDGRSASARRFRDLVRALEAEAGDELSEGQRGLIRHAAALLLRSEQLQVAIVRGEAVDGDELIRLAGTAKRLIAAIHRTADRDVEAFLARLDNA